MTNNFTHIGLWILRILTALIMLQTLFFKFTGAEESIYIFSELGMEPWGRIGTGVLELVASLLILYPRTTFLGAALGVGLMAGALFFHFTKLGIAVRGDGGQLFIYAVVAFLSAAILLVYYRFELFQFIKNLLPKTSKL
jgi:uncharacterized membrane protein YphA (DoxX/SURF4 family)